MDRLHRLHPYWFELFEETSGLSGTDLIIVGGGLAGCSLAWQAKSRGLRVALIDELRADSSSRVAAGLVTPITGARLAISWRWRDFFSSADRLYRTVELACSTRFWFVEPAWRVFTGDEESSLFRDRWCTADGQETLADSGLQIRPVASTEIPWVDSAFGGMAMEPSARLDTSRFLDATRAMLREQGCLHDVNLDCDRDIVPTSEGFRLPSLGLNCRWLVLCQGAAARTNPWFERLPLHPARGDMIEIQSRIAVIDRVVHHHAWAVPLGGQRYLVGATYDRHCLDTRLDHEPALRFRRLLCERWAAMTGEQVSDSIVHHRAGIRPASYDRHPLLGRHARVKNLYCLNGLGSKGSLLAPELANQLLDLLLLGRDIDPSLRWNRRENKQETRFEIDSNDLQ